MEVTSRSSTAIRFWTTLRSYEPTDSWPSGLHRPRHAPALVRSDQGIAAGPPGTAAVPRPGRPAVVRISARPAPPQGRSHAAIGNHHATPQAADLRPHPVRQGRRLQPRSRPRQVHGPARRRLPRRLRRRDAKLLWGPVRRRDRDERRDDKEDAAQPRPALDRVHFLDEVPDLKDEPRGLLRRRVHGPQLQPGA